METINMYKTIDARYKFLSYLWGMETTKNFRRRLTRLSSYPTYEEWKHLWYCFRKILILSSYPTYEEWKPYPFRYILYFIARFLSYLWGMETFHQMRSRRETPCSYPTYEEWKQYFYFFLFYRIYFVLILPMRNGNYDPLSNTTGNLWQFLSYLWGIKNKETRV